MNDAGAEASIATRREGSWLIWLFSQLFSQLLIQLLIQLFSQLPSQLPSELLGELKGLQKACVGEGDEMHFHFRLRELICLRSS